MIQISVRASPDWGDEAEFLRHLRPLMLPLVEVWDATFEMPWRLYRATLTEIARSNLSSIVGGRIAPWEDIPDGDLVVPVDDDDWFSPSILDDLSHADEMRLDAITLAASSA
jgi:hypothetical protein